jgi:hypothetical protein
MTQPYQAAHEKVAKRIATKFPRVIRAQLLEFLKKPFLLSAHNMTSPK